MAARAQASSPTQGSRATRHLGFRPCFSWVQPRTENTRVPQFANVPQSVTGGMYSVAIHS